jgi:hypothetical protein
MIESSVKEFTDISDLKEDIHYESYCLLNSLYRNIAYGTDVADSFTILRYLLNSKKKTVLATDKFADVPDVLNYIIMKYIENNRIPDDVMEYLMICKDLYYYRTKQKYKNDRITLLFYSYYVLSKRQVKYQEIEYKPKLLQDKTNRKKELDYLYVIMPYDKAIIQYVQQEKQMSKLIKRHEKTVNVDSVKQLQPNNPSLNIVKISH